MSKFRYIITNEGGEILGGTNSDELFTLSKAEDNLYPIDTHSDSINEVTAEDLGLDADGDEGEPDDMDDDTDKMTPL